MLVAIERGKWREASSVLERVGLSKKKLEEMLELATEMGGDLFD